MRNDNSKIVKYYNDYNQKAFDKTFENLDELADWIFDQMQLDYTKKPGCDFLTFPTDRFGKWYEIQYDRIMGDMCTGFTKLTVKVALFFRVGNIQPGKILCRKVQEWFQKCEERKKHQIQFVEV